MSVKTATYDFCTNTIRFRDSITVFVHCHYVIIKMQHTSYYFIAFRIDNRIASGHILPPKAASSTAAATSTGSACY